MQMKLLIVHIRYCLLPKGSFKNALLKGNSHETAQI